MKNLISWKMFFILLIACAIASVISVPYLIAIIAMASPNEIEITPKIVFLTAIRNFAPFPIVIFLGLLLSERVGMGFRYKLKPILLPSISWGVLAGLLIILMSLPFISESQNMKVSIPVWKALLATFYGGIAEEVLLRLFLVSLFVWITFKIKKAKDGGPTVFGIWLAIILAAIIFGLAHLPTTARITSLTGIIIARTVVLNGIGGVIFGWLYWKKGLESAMIAHFSADVVLHIVTPFVVSLFS
jgi:membrane protease YdiL (CAAX protease family)